MNDTTDSSHHVIHRISFKAIPYATTETLVSASSHAPSAAICPLLHDTAATPSMCISTVSCLHHGMTIYEDDDEDNGNSICNSSNITEPFIMRQSSQNGCELEVLIVETTHDDDAPCAALHHVLQEMIHFRNRQHDNPTNDSIHSDNSSSSNSNSSNSSHGRWNHARIMPLPESITTIVIENFSFLNEIPFDLLALIFPNFNGTLILDNCARLNSLNNLFVEFGNISHLHLKNCMSIYSIDFLAAIPSWNEELDHDDRNDELDHDNRNEEFVGQDNIPRVQLQLQTLVLSTCGLGSSTSRHDDTLWETGMKAWSMSTSSELNLTIEDCPKFDSLPPCIHYLQDKLSTLHLSNLPQLKRLPAEIGQLHQLQLLVLQNTGIVRLPPEIARLNPWHCQVAILRHRDHHHHDHPYNPTANPPLTVPCVVQDPPMAYCGSIRAMQTYFTLQRVKAWKGFIRLFVLLIHSRRRALERLYEPGGRGYKRCRESFVQQQHQQQQQLLLLQQSNDAQEEKENTKQKRVKVTTTF